MALTGERGPEAVVPLTGRNAGGINLRAQSIVVQKDADFRDTFARTRIPFE
jgi:hypothetical protein